MLMYTLIGLCLVLTGIVGLQFTYMFWVERLYGERRKYTRDLEHKYSELTIKLDAANQRIDQQNKVLGNLGTEEDAWADVIEERRG